MKRAYDKPIEVFSQIGATLPKPAAFFINFIIIKALTGLPSELMRATSYMQHLVKILFVCVFDLWLGSSGGGGVDWISVGLNREAPSSPPCVRAIERYTWSSPPPHHNLTNPLTSRPFCA